jgi:hypothetical protein
MVEKSHTHQVVFILAMPTVQEKDGKAGYLNRCTEIQQGNKRSAKHSNIVMPSRETSFQAVRSRHGHQPLGADPAITSNEPLVRN